MYECRDTVVVVTLPSHQCGSALIPDAALYVVEFVGSLLCIQQEVFFPGYSGFPLSSKNNQYLI